MIYIPDNFRPEEIFCPIVCEMKSYNTYNNKKSKIDESIWSLMDNRALITLQRLRNKYGATYVNNWGSLDPRSHTGPVYKYRGFRYFPALIKIQNDGTFIIDQSLSPTSQHFSGRAIDCTFEKTTAQQVRQDMRQFPQDKAFEFIRGVEEKYKNKPANWLHFDVGNRRGSGITFFNV